MSPGNSRTAQGFVYMVTDSNKIRKISLGTYQIVKERGIPMVGDGGKDGGFLLKVLSLAINNQGKVLLVVCNRQVLIMD